jgi:hypothetical protein
MNRREFLSSAPLLGTAVLASNRAAAAGEGMVLLGESRSAQVLASPGHEATASYFAQTLDDLTGQKIEVVTQPAAGNRPLILIGDTSNETVHRLAGRRAPQLTPQGILLLTASEGGRPVLLVAAGSASAVPGAAGELLNFRLDAGVGRASVGELDVVDNPALPYRIFWNWDHSTNWVRGVPGEQENGCENPYMKRGEDYLNDYRRVTDYMGEHKINGLIVWGFLRDTHGGAEASNKLVEFAATRGVRILPGIGSSGYGGFYYDGRNRFNADTWLAQGREELRFLDPDGNRLKNTICPSQPENQAWLQEGARWMFSEFPKLGGVNLEHGDFIYHGVFMSCQCQACRRSRAKTENDPNFYFDMMYTQLPIIEASRKKRPDAWMTYATYTGFSPQELWQNTDPSQVRSKVPRFVSRYPEEAICQWTYTNMVEGWGRLPEAEVRKKWPAGLRPPTKHSIGLLHQGSQWHNSDIWWTQSQRQNNTGERYVDISELIRYSCSRCAEEGLEGLEILGEVSDASPANELNYLAFEEFAWHPRHTWDEFYRDRLARIYGSEEDARRFVTMVRSEERSLQALLRDLHTADEIGQNRQFNSRQRRRWQNLRAEIARRISVL